MHHITIQRALSKRTYVPKNNLMRMWVKKTLNAHPRSIELTIRLVSINEMVMLNKRYRNKEGPTNILSFRMTQIKGLEYAVPLLGDMVLCPEIVNEQAKEQHKPLESHWAHLIIHGTLHLLGHDHQNQIDATHMESLEIQLMEQLNFNNPYYLRDNHDQ